MDDVAALGTILGLWAHPDDETYLSAALMAAAVDNGQRVVVVSATAGERGTDDPVAWPPHRLAPVRRWEATAAMATLGVTDHRWLGLGVGELAGHDPDDGARRVADVIAEVDPDTILTFGPDGMTGHPDHEAISAWTSEGHRLAGGRARVLHAATDDERSRRFRRLHDRFDVFLAPGLPSTCRRGDLAIDLHLCGPALDRKLVALRAQATQTRPVMDAFGADEYEAWVAQEAFIDATTPAGDERIRSR